MPRRPLTPKARRLRLVLACIAVMGIAGYGILSSFRDQLIFFYTPTDLQTLALEKKSREMRVGGLVEQGSIQQMGTSTVHFVITDLTHRVPATYTGLVPALFREGQGVVAQGKLNAQGVMEAKTILAKHDEKYMPKEVVEALKKSGQWQKEELKN